MAALGIPSSWVDRLDHSRRHVSVGDDSGRVRHLYSGGLGYTAAPRLAWAIFMLSPSPSSKRSKRSPRAMDAAAATAARACLVFVVLGSIVFQAAQCNLEGDILHTLRRNLHDPENVLQSWDPTLVDPCTWFHITCDKQNRVIRVDLGNANLSGSLVPGLGKLEHLKHLELYKNKIGGNIPKELGKLKNLVSLDLYMNNFTGEIPRSLGNLKSLAFLRLNNNRLTGRIPRGLARIASLKIVDLSNNHLCGTIPASGSFAQFSPNSFDNNPRLKGPELQGFVPYDTGC